MHAHYILSSCAQSRSRCVFSSCRTVVHVIVCCPSSIPASTVTRPANILPERQAPDAWRASLLRRGGVIIKQMREQSGAHIKVLSPEELPACALSNDRVVQCASARGHLSYCLSEEEERCLPWTCLLEKPELELTGPVWATLSPCMHVGCCPATGCTDP